MAKRQKTVFDSHELPHIWASRSQPYGRNAQGNFYFEGNTIYSYGGHFPIATFVDWKGKTYCFFTTRSYSNTTAKQISRTRQALTRDIPIIYCENPPRFHENVNLQWLKNLAADRLKHFQEVSASINEKGIRQTTRDKRTLAARAAAIAYNELLDTFKIRRKRLDLENLAAECTKAGERLAAEERRTAKRRAEQEENRKKKDEERRIELAQQLEDWTHNGGTYSVGWYSFPVRLRLKNNQIETSHGASIDSKLAAGIYRRLVAARARGSFEGLNTDIGQFNAQRVETDHFVIGCHEIPFSEIDRIAAELGLVNSPELEGVTQ